MESKMDFSQVNLKIGNTNMLRNEAFRTSDPSRACSELLPWGAMLTFLGGFFFPATLCLRAKVVSPGSPSAGSLDFRHRTLVWCGQKLEDCGLK